jgi:hypothetical protein
LFTYEVEKGLIRINLSWRNLILDVYIYKCSNIYKNLLKEVEYRLIKPEDPIAIVPTSLIKTPLQLLQGSLYYKLYSNGIKRVKNRGLLLAMMITGNKQINKVVEALGVEIERGVDYYLVSLESPPSNTNMCTPLSSLEIDGSREVLRPLVKNTSTLLELI